MKRYHLEILVSSRAFVRKTVDADSVSIGSGAYCFKNLNKESLQPIAFYPVNRTIIAMIEDIEKSTESECLNEC